MKIDVLKEARAIEEELIRNRRHLHAHAEVGFELDKTVAFVYETLTSYGLSPRYLTPHGVTATVGKGRPVVLLRADMDALPGTERSAVDFRSEENMHMCGHDMHTAMLLGAAKLLKAHEAELEGTVKFVFQPAEELLMGARSLIDAGLLENPEPDAAFMIHVNTLDEPALYLKSGVMTTSNNNFRITVRGKSAHGAMPELGIDATYVGAKIVTALPAIVAREIPFAHSAVVTTGHFVAGDSPNSIPDTAVIEGTIRSFDEEIHAFVRKRVIEIAKSVAHTYRAEAEVEILSEAKVVKNDPALADLAREAAIAAGIDVREAKAVQASEDFSFIASRVPSVMMMLGVKPDSGEVYPLHNPHAVFNETSMKIGVAALAAIAVAFLQTWKK